MSSRGELIGQGPSSGLYKPGPVPPEAEELSVYTNDELLILGGIVNGILQGGAFPPQGRLPIRWREGSMVYYTKALDDTYQVGELAGQQIITSAGIWLYRRERWWKVLDDPSAIDGQTTIYQLTADGNAPPTPPTGPDYPPAGWFLAPPVKGDKGEYIWASLLVQKQDETDYVWSNPTIWSAGVVDGEDGAVGPPGVDGRVFQTWFLESATQPQPPANEYPPTGGWVSTTPANPTDAVWSSFILVAEDGTNPEYPWSFPIKVTGEAGPPGEDGKRGSLNISATTTGSTWNSTEAYNAIANDPNSGGTVNVWDSVTLVNDSTQYSEQRYYNGGGNPGVWTPIAFYVDGNAIINGTIGANKLVANSITANEIAAGTIVGDNINAGTQIRIGGSNGTQQAVILDATNATSRIWVGDLSDPGGALFRVEPNGTMHATNAIIRGTLNAGDIQGGVGTIVGFKNLPTYPWQIGSGGSWVDYTVFTLTIPREDYERTVALDLTLNRVYFDQSNGANIDGHFTGGSGSDTLFVENNLFVDAQGDFSNTTEYFTSNRDTWYSVLGQTALISSNRRFISQIRVAYDVTVKARPGVGGNVNIPIKVRFDAGVIGIPGGTVLRMRAVSASMRGTINKSANGVSVS